MNAASAESPRHSHKRPALLFIIGVWIIAKTMLAMFELCTTAPGGIWHPFVPLRGVYLFVVVTSVLPIVAGIGLLRVTEWGRVLMIVACLAELVWIFPIPAVLHKIILGTVGNPLGFDPHLFFKNLGVIVRNAAIIFYLFLPKTRAKIRDYQRGEWAGIGTGYCGDTLRPP